MAGCIKLQVYLKISRLVLTYLEVNLKLLQSKGNSWVYLSFMQPALSLLCTDLSREYPRVGNLNGEAYMSGRASLSG